MASARAVPNVVGSDECNAYCSILTKQCGGSCPVQQCEIEFCAEATKAALKCFAKGAFPGCDAFPPLGLDCDQANFSSLCPDAGTDASTIDAPADGG